MNYFRQYFALMTKAENRDPAELDGVYVENHHIFPVSIYGKNPHTVALSYKEHMVAHHLLYKAYLKEYGALDSRTNSMGYALALMINVQSKYLHQSKTSQIAKRIKNSNKIKRFHTEEYKQKLSLKRCGELNPFYGKTHSQSSRELISVKTKGKAKSPETRRRMNERWTEEERAKYSKMYSKENNPMYGRTHTPEARAMISEKNRGRVVSEEARKKQSVASTGRVQSEEQKERARERFRDPEYKRAASERFTAEKNPRYDYTKRTWINKDGRIEEGLTKFEFRQKYGYTSSVISSLVLGKRKIYKGWSLLKSASEVNDGI